MGEHRAMLPALAARHTKRLPPVRLSLYPYIYLSVCPSARQLSYMAVCTPALLSLCLIVCHIPPGARPSVFVQPNSRSPPRRHTHMRVAVRRRRWRQQRAQHVRRGGAAVGERRGAATSNVAARLCAAGGPQQRRALRPRQLRQPDRGPAQSLGRPKLSGRPQPAQKRRQQAP
jgi:hypothetical protein